MSDRLIGKINRDNLISLLEDIDVEIVGESTQDLIAFCPFHNNKDTPALNISKESPYVWRCWSPKCAESGTLPRLVQQLGGMTHIESLRYIYRYRSQTIDAIDRLIKRAKEDDYELWPESKLNSTLIPYDDPVFDQLYKRGFTKETLAFFDVGYSNKQKRITIPVRDDWGNFVGFTGRATLPLQRKYWDKGLPKRFILFNLNLAKKYDEVIVVEGPLDALKIWQAGYHNVVAIMGGGFTGEQAKKLLKNFQSVIIFTDNDEPGKAFAQKIEGVMRKGGKRVFYVIYPEGKKDPGEMTNQEIKECIDNKVTALENKVKEILEDK